MADDKTTPSTPSKTTESESKAVTSPTSTTPSTSSPSDDIVVGNDTTGNKDTKANDQFPSLSGDTETEISKRNVDSDSGSKYVKQYVVLLAKEAKGNVEDYQHDANIKETREFMLHAGLRPTGDVRFVGAEPHPDGVSTILTYEGDVLPAAVSGDAGKESDVVLAQQIEKESKEGNAKDSSNTASDSDTANADSGSNRSTKSGN